MTAKTSFAADRVHSRASSSVDRSVRFLVSVLVLVTAAPAAAQGVVVQVPPPPCVAPCPPCSPVGPCPPCPPGCRQLTVEGGASVGVTVESGISGSVTVQGGGTGSHDSQVTVHAPPEPAEPRGPVPGSVHLGYFGGTDGRVTFHGGAMRATGHFGDIYFLDFALGGTGSVAAESIWEGFLLVGLRIAGAVVPNILRLFAALDVALSVRGLATNYWSAIGSELGLGLEVAFGEWSMVGFFTDVRLVTRVPVAVEPAWVGFGWSAGLALLWF